MPYSYTDDPMAPDPLAALLALKRRSVQLPYGDNEEDGTFMSPNLEEAYPELLRAPDIGRNYAKTSALRAALGMKGPDVGDVSQRDYEQAYEQLIVPQQEREFRAKIAPAIITAQGNVQAARERAQGDQRLALQLQRQGFQEGQNRLNREAGMERIRTAAENAVVPSMDPTTGLTTWIPRTEAPGQRAGGTSTEREAIQQGQNTVDNIGMLINMGDALGWKGIGPAGGVKNTLYKFLGIGDPREDDFRSALQKVRADIMFGAGGKQLTTSEQRVAAGYLTDIYTNPTAARSRLVEIKQILERAQGRRTGIASVPSSATEWEDVR